MSSSKNNKKNADKDWFYYAPLDKPIIDIYRPVNTIALPYRPKRYLDISDTNPQSNIHSSVVWKEIFAKEKEIRPENSVDSKFSLL